MRVAVCEFRAVYMCAWMLACLCVFVCVSYYVLCRLSRGRSRAIVVRSLDLSMRTRVEAENRTGKRRTSVKTTFLSVVSRACKLSTSARDRLSSDTIRRTLSPQQAHMSDDYTHPTSQLALLDSLLRARPVPVI